VTEGNEESPNHYLPEAELEILHFAQNDMRKVALQIEHTPESSLA
jgi:hypothetical protein